MAEIVNLRQERKRRLRQERKREAAVQRARFGRTGSEQEREVRLRDLAERQLDDHRRDDGPDAEG